MIKLFKSEILFRSSFLISFSHSFPLNNFTLVRHTLVLSNITLITYLQQTYINWNLIFLISCNHKLLNQLRDFKFIIIGPSYQNNKLYKFRWINIKIEMLLEIHPEWQDRVNRN